jgi:hypothetical protein
MLPKTLYHYSDVAGVCGIITSRSLWASDTTYMSDKTEFAYPREVLARVVERMKVTATSRDARWILDGVAGVLAKASSGLPVYAACLCASGDLRSQWDDHADHGTGFAVGLDRDKLRVAGLPRRYNLGPVIYAVSEQEALLEKSLAEAIEVVPQYAGAMGSPEKFLLLFALGITITLTVIKNGRFKGEHEWRLMRQELLGGASPDVKRRGPAGTPYEEFALDDAKTGTCLITEVVAGPSATRVSVEEVRRLLDWQGLNHVVVKRSALSP